MADGVVVRYLVDKIDLQANLGGYLHAPILGRITDSNRFPRYELVYEGGGGRIYRGCARSWVLAVLAFGVGVILRGFPGLRNCHSW